MSIVTILKRYGVRGGTAADLASVNEVPLVRELVFETDTGKFKIGDGSTNYNDLPYHGTDQTPEGSTNLYFTYDRAYTSAKAQLVAGTNVSITPDDGARMLIISASGGGSSSSGGEILVQDGSSAPPVMLTNEAEDDFIYSD